MPTSGKLATVISIAAAVLTTFLGATTVSAASVNLFSDRAAWTQGVSVTGSDDFESYNWHTGVDNGKVLAWSINTGGAYPKSTELAGARYTPTGVFYGVESVTYDSPFLTTQYILWQEGGQRPATPNTVTILMPDPVQAFAFDFAMFRGDVSTYAIEFDNGLSLRADTKSGMWNFFGMTTDTSFQTVKVTAGLYPVVDNMAWGLPASVPEPASLSLVLAACLAGLAATRRFALNP